METITSINRYTTKKDGTPLVTARGKPYTSVRITTQEHGTNILSGFGNSENAQWKVGDKVDIIVEQKGSYWNFSMPKKGTNSELMPLLNKILANQEKMMRLLETKSEEFPDVDTLPEFKDEEPY